MKTIIHVNQHIIKSNKKYNLNEPVLTVKQNANTNYCSEVIIDGPSKIIYSPENPLSCGAHVWLETDSDVKMIGSKKFKDVKRK